ncbi:MAG: hypothetical protein ACRDIY_00310 [Chloroflexota bacterium]
MKRLILAATEPHRTNPGPARVVLTHPASYLGRRTRYLELHVPGERAAVHRIPLAGDDPGALARATARLREEASDRGYTLRNPDFFVAGGVIHPIAHSPGYSEKHERQLALLREETGQTAQEQQEGRQFDKEIERAERAQEQARVEAPLADRLDQLQTDADYLREKLKSEPANRFAELVSDRGRARAESGLIPFETARRYLPKSPERYTTALVKRDGKKYLRWEYTLDEIANDQGYPSGDAFRAAIEQARKDRRKLASLNAEIRAVKADLRRAHHKRNPEPTGLLGWLRCVLGLDDDDETDEAPPAREPRRRR